MMPVTDSAKEASASCFVPEPAYSTANPPKYFPLGSITDVVITAALIFEYENLDVTKEHGSVFTAICFVSYKIPTLKKSNSNSRRMKRRRTKSKKSKSKKSKSKK